jgi:hypothetical protein
LCGKNESSVREVMKNKEKIRDLFIAPQTAEVTAMVHDSVNEGGKTFLLLLQHFDGKA